ncbi:acyl-homoserine-lactone synthase TraI [Pararhizobium sp. DWP3-4]|uniref:acyl-homoserine-lactone synthase n=1 Tax=Pararhizobium sp. DWP3-4 TaxID=2804565 RepID=UPI003CE97C92
MQILAFSTPQDVDEARVLQSHHELRARVFSDRLGWDVNVVDGCEADGFDGIGPTYVFAISSSGQLAGCARLLPASGPTMLVNVFPSLLPSGYLDAHAAMIESSRFCVDTTLGEGKGVGSVHEVTLTMFAGIIEWSIANGFREIITVTDLRFERILARVGWPLARLGEPKKIGVTMAVAGTLPASSEIFQKLRPADYQSKFTTHSARPHKEHP